MKYITNYQIIDTEQDNKYYKKNSEYPAKNTKVSEERIKELLDKKHIRLNEEYAEVKELKDHTVKELKKKAANAGLEGYADLKKEELVELVAADKPKE